MDAKQGWNDYQVSSLLYTQKRYNDSLAILNELEKSFPDNIKIRLGRARCLFHLEHYHECLSICEDILSVSNDSKAVELRDKVLALAPELSHPDQQQFVIAETDIQERLADNATEACGTCPVPENRKSSEYITLISELIAGIQHDAPEDLEIPIQTEPVTWTLDNDEMTESVASKQEVADFPFAEEAPIVEAMVDAEEEELKPLLDRSGTSMQNDDILMEKEAAAEKQDLADSFFIDDARLGQGIAGTEDAETKVFETAPAAWMFNEPIMGSPNHEEEPSIETPVEESAVTHLKDQPPFLEQKQDVPPSGIDGIAGETNSTQEPVEYALSLEETTNTIPADTGEEPLIFPETEPIAMAVNEEQNAEQQAEAGPFEYTPASKSGSVTGLDLFPDLPMDKKILDEKSPDEKTAVIEAGLENNLSSSTRVLKSPPAAKAPKIRVKGPRYLPLILAGLLIAAAVAGTVILSKYSDTQQASPAILHYELPVSLPPATSETVQAPESTSAKPAGMDVQHVAEPDVAVPAVTDTVQLQESAPAQAADTHPPQEQVPAEMPPAATENVPLPSDNISTEEATSVSATSLFLFKGTLRSGARQVNVIGEKPSPLSVGVSGSKPVSVGFVEGQGVAKAVDQIRLEQGEIFLWVSLQKQSAKEEIISVEACHLAIGEQKYEPLAYTFDLKQQGPFNALKISSNDSPAQISAVNQIQVPADTPMTYLLFKLPDSRTEASFIMGEAHTPVTISTTRASVTKANAS